MAVFKNIVTLMSGTTIAQAIPLAISPILTRIYSPSDFGVLAIYSSIMAVIAVIATCRYELAILQPKQNDDAKSLVFLSFISVIFISTLSFIFALFYNKLNWNFFKNDDIGSWLYLLPVSIICIGVYNICNYWLLRSDKYASMAQGKVIQGGTISAVQAILGFLKKTGLILGLIIGQIFSALFLFFKCRKDFKNLFKIKKEKIVQNALNYKKMPMLSTPGAFADTLSLQMPILFVSYFFGGFLTGLFSFTIRILSTPSALIGVAVSQVVFKKVNDDLKENGNKILFFILKVYIGLLVIISPILIIVFLFGEDIFEFIFGNKWSQAGEIAKLLVFAILVRFPISALSSVLSVEKNIKLGTLWQFTYLVTIVSVLFVFSHYEFNKFLMAFVVHEVTLYFIYFILILIGAKRLQEN